MLSAEGTPSAVPVRNRLMRALAAKSDMPMSCRYRVRKTIAVHGIVPRMPCSKGAAGLAPRQLEDRPFASRL